MAIDNNVNLQQVSNQYQRNDILTEPQKYQGNPNAVDKTPDKDTVQLSSHKLSNKEKAGIVVVATTAVAITLAVLGRNGHLGKSVQKFLGGNAKEFKNTVQETVEHTKTPTGATQATKPEPVKMEMTDEARKAYDDVASNLNKNSNINSETIDNNLVPKEKAGAWSKEDRQKYYQKLEKESDAKIKAEQEAKAQAEQKVKAETEREAKAKARKEVEVKGRRLGFKYADENMEELDKLFLDKNGNLVGVSDNGTEKCDFKDLVKPFDEELGTIYHGTTPEAKEKILTEGFRQDVPIAHGDQDGVGGTYFAFNMKDGQGYGSVVKAKFNGKVAHVDTEKLEYILKPTLQLKVMKSNIGTGATYPEKLAMRKAIVLRYLQNKLKQMGYQGLVNDYSYAAACPYFSALDPSLIQIIK